MKLKILTLLAAGLVFFSSCTPEEIDPVLEIYVNVKSSENWENANFYVPNVRFAQEIDGGTGFANPQDHVETWLDLSLESETSTLVWNDSHFDIEKLIGLKLDVMSLHLSNADAGAFKVDVPWYTFGELDESISIENGKTYKIEYTIDFDEQIFEEDGKKVLDNNFGLKVTEL